MDWSAEQAMKALKVSKRRSEKIFSYVKKTVASVHKGKTVDDFLKKE